jgi:hypothetical protein
MGFWERLTDWLRRVFGRRSRPRAPQRFQTVFQSSKGPIHFDADLSLEGELLVISEIEVFPTEVEHLGLGTGEMLRLLRPLYRRLAEERGATEVLLKFRRLEHSGRPGREGTLRWRVR